MNRVLDVDCSRFSCGWMEGGFSVASGGLHFLFFFLHCSGVEDDELGGEVGQAMDMRGVEHLRCYGRVVYYSGGK